MVRSLPRLTMLIANIANAKGRRCNSPVEKRDA